MSKRSDRRRREHLQRLAAVALEAGQTAARQENATHQDACHLVDKLLAADPVLTHGGGPRTPEGKARSAQNSFRYGLAASFHRFQLLPGEDPREYTELCADLQSQFRPRTPAERHKLEDMAQAWWLQRRARNFQTAALADGDAKCFALYLRYETSQRRSYQMAYKDFQDMQKARPLVQSSPDLTPVAHDASFQSERHYPSRQPDPSPAAPEAPADHPAAA
jgi:hypothetical protein